MNDELKLAPCPFCGSEKLDVSIGLAESPSDYIMCNDETGCGAMISREDTKDGDLIAAWNRRATPSPSTAPIAGDERAASAILKSIIEDGYLSETKIARYHALASKPAARDADTEKLKQAALAATPGPWTWWTSNSLLRLTGADGKDGGVLCPYYVSGHADLECSEANRAFIAAANPAAVLELVAEVERLRAASSSSAAREAARQSIDTPEFREMLRDYGGTLGLIFAAHRMNEVIAHIDTWGASRDAEAVRDAERYRHIRSPANNGYELRGPAGIDKWHVSRKVCDGEGEYLWGEYLDAAIDRSIGAAPAAGNTAQPEK